MIFKRKRKYRNGRVAEFPHWYNKFIRNRGLMEVNTKQGTPPSGPLE